MFASFYSNSKGTLPSCSDMLNTCASGLLICYTVSFSILGDNPSTPGDLFSFIFLILLATTSGVTINCPNLSSSDPLNLHWWHAAFGYRGYQYANQLKVVFILHLSNKVLMKNW